ncbi:MULTISPECIES: hypothetical protein [Shewanella]|uniref:hypothetical protein n=1 Tax=Shewanella TaxID=22 RepID=UPI000B342397|nr:hypothetical protein KVP08_022845 [Shewanella putrefaciens]
MLNQLTQLNTIGGAERLNFSIVFLGNNKARVVLTSKVQDSATGELAELLKRPIVVTGSLSDIDMMLANELFNLAESAVNIQAPLTQTAPQSTSAIEPAISDSVKESETDTELDDEESL